MKSQFPQNIINLLWDVNVPNVTTSKHYKFIIERIIEYGDLAEIEWMKGNFNREKIIETLKTSRNISARSGNFFALLFNLSKSEIKCLQQPFIQKQNRFGI